jgi:hypothetical protein
MQNTEAGRFWKAQNAGTAICDFATEAINRVKNIPDALSCSL